MTTLYIALLPSDLSVSLLEYLDPVAISRLITVLEEYPELYERLYPLNKLKVLRKQYISSKLPTDYTFEQVMDDYVYYRNLSVPVIPAGAKLLEVKNILMDIRDMTHNLVDMDWDIAIISYMRQLQKQLNELNFRLRLLDAYDRAIKNDKLNSW